MTKFEMKIPPLPKVPDTIPMYKTVKPSIDRGRELIIGLGKSIGLKSGLKGSSETPEVFSVQEEKRVLEFFKASGAIWYGDMAKLWQEEPMDYTKAFGVKKKSEAEGKIRGMAEDFLKRNELIPKEAYFIGTGEAEFAQEGKETVMSEMQTNFGFKLEDIPVVGPGAKITVNFGYDGNIMGFFKSWRDVEKSKKLPLTTPRETLAKLERSRIFADLEAGSEVVIRKFYLAYYALPVLERQDYLLPVYVIEGHVRTRHFKHDFTRYVPAVSADTLKKTGMLVDPEIFPDPDLL